MLHGALRRDKPAVSGPGTDVGVQGDQSLLGMAAPMATISVKRVTQAYRSKKLIQEVMASFSDGRRYGLTGPNGAGKSTFLKILSGDLDPDTGSVSRPERTSVLKQDQFAYESLRVLSVVIMGNKRLWEVMEE